MMIKAELNVCYKYKSCFAQRLTILESEAGSDCINCDLYRSYQLGFSEGVRRTVDAMNNVKPLIRQPYQRGVKE